ncbi:hypothetical protein ROZALSC1DRAFT_31685 [Rozella allomycis CSF55]|uniref:DNA-directed RNA polymerase I subunit RPA12 n=1 Tax=Rozella allomycis (strain CSF55) TaxID=988480 RepID=A0A4P9YBX2_ROZAC|nr:hypothetical protein ROZALSC1DRAFT_31685 [Rozella allomycis CSF55]
MTLQFCPECSNLLDYPGDQSHVTCNTCGYIQSAQVFENNEVVHESKRDLFVHLIVKEKEERLEEGATIKEKCPKCGNPEMTFHTMQLRSADEGQTVFYTCPKCASIPKGNNINCIYSNKLNSETLKMNLAVI